MYHEAFTKLELEDVATIMDQVNPLLEGTPFDPIETIIMAWDIPFYAGYRLLDISDHSSIPVLKRFVIYSPQDQVVIDWKNETIYSLNQKLPIQLDENNIVDYVVFFFTYVRGKHGRFLIVENIDDIAWKDEPPQNARKPISEMIKPVQLSNEKSDKGDFKLNVCMMFKDSLFQSSVTVGKDGYVTMGKEELLIEDMPVLDDVLGQ